MSEEEKTPPPPPPADEVVEISGRSATMESFEYSEEHTADSEGQEKE